MSVHPDPRDPIPHTRDNLPNRQFSKLPLNNEKTGWLRLWRWAVIVITPIVACPLLFIGTQEAKCAFTLVVMAVYWMTEVMPIAATSFIPICLFPLLGILPISRVCANYLKDTNFMFAGGMIMALAVEECRLHERIALSTLLLVGTSVRAIMAGFMIVTAFLSMWISNTATTAMVVPIAVAVLENLVGRNDNKKEKVEKNGNGTHIEMGKDGVVEGGELDLANDKEAYGRLTLSDQRVCQAVLLSVCYSANIGGTGTLQGTGPNLVLRGILSTMFPGEDTGITFASWLPFAIPPMLLCLFLAWVWLQISALGIKKAFTFGCCGDDGNKKAEQDVRKVLEHKHSLLGRVGFGEWSVLFWFGILLLLWLLRDPKFMPGWGALLRTLPNGKSYVSDAWSAMTISIIMFIWPRDKPTRSGPLPKPLITWNVMQHKFQWGVIILLGGGFALAEGVKESGLSAFIGCTLQSWLSTTPPIVIVIVATTVITFITEVSSNTATATVFIPICISLAISAGLHPLYLALPATIAPSFAFMLPVATPPNAIVYETGAVTTAKMMSIGLIMNVLCIGVTILNTTTWANLLFGLGTQPEWAKSAGNSTC